MFPVVVWCHCVGGIQWRTDPLPCRRPAVPHPTTGGGAETQETSQRSLFHRDVSVHSNLSTYLRQEHMTEGASN